MLRMSEFVKASNMKAALGQSNGVGSGPCDKTTEISMCSSGPCDITEGQSAPIAKNGKEVWLRCRIIKNVVPGKLGIEIPIAGGSCHPLLQSPKSDIINRRRKLIKVRLDEDYEHSSLARVILFYPGFNKEVAFLVEKKTIVEK
jgi:hypothetical protein